MSEKSKQYAAALFEVCREKNCEDEVYNGMVLAGGVFRNVPEFVPFLRSPAINLSTRLNTLDETFKDDVHEYVLSFLALLCRQGEADIFPECVKDYEEILTYSKNTCHAKVTSAVALSNEQKSRLEEKLIKKIKKNIEVDYVVDPSLLGGVTVETDGELMDGSIKRRLQTIKEVIDR